MHGEYIKEHYKDKLKGDDHLFIVRDQRLGDEAVPHVVIGEQAEGFANNGHYDIEYQGPNPSSRAALATEARIKLQEEFGKYTPMKSVAEELADEKAKNEALLAELEALKASASTKKASKKAKADEVEVEEAPTPEVEADPQPESEEGQ